MRDVNRAERAVRDIRGEHAVGTLHPETVVGGIVRADVRHARAAHFKTSRAAVRAEQNSRARPQFAAGQNARSLRADLITKTDAHTRNAANRSVPRGVEQSAADVERADAAGIQTDFHVAAESDGTIRDSDCAGVSARADVSDRSGITAQRTAGNQ